MELKCAVQNYEWGKRGLTSEVARLAKLNADIEIEDSVCYAELWMGTHVNGPSYVVGGSKRTKKLADHIRENQDCLGDHCRNNFRGNLPFLLKVLSVNLPLSIQAHPNKELAEKLNIKQPTVYKDNNHKPEMAIALTPFEAMCGFRPIEDLLYYFNNVPEIELLVGIETLEEFREDPSPETLQEVFRKVMTADESVIKAAVNKVLRRLGSADSRTREKENALLIERLNKGFPNDVGVLGPYFFNVIRLKPGEALFLPANEPHAYLSGDCIECMASSDNVVRAGLTPKPKDVETLITMLEYTTVNAESWKFAPIEENEYSKLFSPPVPDFDVAKITVPAGTSYKLIKRPSASILIVIQGCGAAERLDVAPVVKGKNVEKTDGYRPFRTDITLRSGTVLFLSVKENLKMEVSESLLMFQAFAGDRDD